jgi:hypothetical protein
MNTKLYALSGLALIIALAACILAATAGSRALKKLQGAATDSSGQVSLLSSRITSLEKQLKDISAALDDIKTAQERRAASSARVAIDENAPESLNDYLVSINDAMYQLEEIVDASGLKSIATNLAVDPTILKNLYDEQYRRKKETEHRNAMVQLNTAQHEADTADYGEEVQTLYEASRFQFGRRDQDQNRTEAEAAREKAMNELIEKYPDANATGMIIAENAMGAAFRGNLEDAEKYYAMLMETEKRSQVVTDWGMKAAPTMQYYLASQYIEKGRTREAEDLIYQLEQSGNEMIFAAGQQRGRRWPGYQTTTDAVSDLRKQLGQK